LRLWDFPSVFDHVAVADTEYIRELVRQKPWRADSRSPDWLGFAVAQRLHLDATNKSDVIKIQRLLGVWLNNGLFSKTTMNDEQRRPRAFYVAVDNAPDADDADE
jgi:hypothetical protein